MDIEYYNFLIYNFYYFQISVTNDAGLEITSPTTVDEQSTRTMASNLSGSKNKKRKLNNIDSLLNEATKTMTEMSNLARSKPKTSGDAIETFAAFVANELRDIRAAGNDYLFRQTKRKIQQVLFDAMDVIDSQATPSCSSPSYSTQMTQWQQENIPILHVNDTGSINIETLDTLQCEMNNGEMEEAN